MCTVNSGDEDNEDDEEEDEDEGDDDEAEVTPGNAPMPKKRKAAHEAAKKAAKKSRPNSGATPAVSLLSHGYSFEDDGVEDANKGSSNENGNDSSDNDG